MEPRAVLAIDPGTKRTGFAVADALGIGARPLEVWSGDGGSAELIERVAERVAEFDAGTLVVGWPLNVDGGGGPASERSERLAERLARRLPGVEVVLRDEHLTTKEAEDLLRHAGHHGAARRARRDSWSALVLLLDYLESRR